MMVLSRILSVVNIGVPKGLKKKNWRRLWGGRLDRLTVSASRLAPSCKASSFISLHFHTYRRRPYLFLKTKHKNVAWKQRCHKQNIAAPPSPGLIGSAGDSSFFRLAPSCSGWFLFSFNGVWLNLARLLQALTGLSFYTIASKAISIVFFSKFDI